ncbi:MAG: diadenylate cyclase CdaA [Eubacteriales bacterium]|nr:diadenylate cyclase CdaA [Eubacteriales bacterium]
MSEIFTKIHEFMIRYSIPTIHIRDIVQILIMAFIIYEAMVFLRKTQAWTLLKGLIFIFLFTVVIKLLHFDVLYWLISRALNLFLIMLVVVFQPELRAGLDRLGRRGVAKALFSMQQKEDNVFNEQSVREITAACAALAKTKTGLLMAIEHEVPLNDLEKTGIALDAKISKQLIMNTFEYNTPLHDGAVIIRGNRIVAATCYFPLSKNINISKSLGTRHRAALGISEITDCTCLVVSEETGHISVANRGILEENITPVRLEEILKTTIEEKAKEKAKKFNFLKGLFEHEEDDQE